MPFLPKDLSAFTVKELESLIQDLKLEETRLKNELKLRQSAHLKIVADCGLSLLDIKKFSRHLLLPEFGVNGQLAVSQGSVLVVGAGGLGCPAIQYLASSGVARLGIVDHDTVELSNLHRQILHKECGVGSYKAESAKVFISELNSDVQVMTYNVAINSVTVMKILESNFDVVLDCSDNVATRYLLNDACVLKGIPLVSGSALRFEGQLTVYNYKNGPTYRCLYPTPPPPELVTNCSDGGVLGPVPGVIGVLQALEALKILSDTGDVLSGKLLLFDAMTSSFRTVKLRGRSDASKVEGLIDYEQFCGSKATDKDAMLDILPHSDRISASELAKSANQLIIDVRTPEEMKICALPNSFNVPMESLETKTSELLEAGSYKNVVVVCRRGNDSQLAVERLKKKFPDIHFCDLIGGLHAWAKNVDNSFPVY